MSPFLVLSLVLLYFIILLAISYITSRDASNASFFLGERKSPWFVVAFGMIGASLSGVTFISVPGWVGSSGFSYMQMVFGYLFGYAFIYLVLLPVYYKMQLTSIYTYLDERFGITAYKTGASLFLISRIIGASFRLFLVASVLQLAIFDSWNIPFWLTVIITILFIWLYTYRGGIKTIIWTDTLQTLFMLTALALTILFIARAFGWGAFEVIHNIKESDYSKLFHFDNWRGENHFFKQFFSGAFITIVMTGLDQDMMQKNLSCRNLKDAQKNMFWFSIILVPVNLLFLSLGVLLFLYSAKMGVAVPEQADNLFPLIALGGYLPAIVGVMFIIGLVAAAYSSADSALTALTTSFTIDILDGNSWPEEKLKRNRMWVHMGVSAILAIVIFVFNQLNNESVISALFKAAGFTYGPLLGLYAFGLFTPWKVKTRWIPYIAILSPIICYVLNLNSEAWFDGYSFGFEILILNGTLTFLGLLLIRNGRKTASA